MSNRLKNATSPYLLQHAENPVNWYPWCNEAFEKAKADNKPIFLSVGYSTCHWCHVMAHESFENEEIAEILNKYFISIKVDREERADIDSVYMSVCQAFTERGGWPMSIFMTWDKKPFFAGTYFPPRSRPGAIGFDQLLLTIAAQWQEEQTALLEYADKIITHIKTAQESVADASYDDLAWCAADIFTQSFDKANGGFGRAPKFPTPHNLLFLMLYTRKSGREELLEMAEKTLISMRKGGIFDHIGYGFSRYSTDEYYLAPHFEKMLYDNGLLIIAYAAAYSVTGKEIYLDTARKTAEYVLKEMTSEEGGFYSAQDADSEGVEGRYYTFTLKEITDVLGEDTGKEFARNFDITEKGNFEGANIVNLLKNDNLDVDFKTEREKLYKYRKSRFKLHLDDKILLSWNSIMIAALAMLSRMTKEEKYLLAAENAQKFIEKELAKEHQLYTGTRDGRHTEKAFLEDYAFYTAALIELYNTTLDRSYLLKAKAFCNEATKRFADPKNGGFYMCEESELFINPKEVYDGAIPSGNSVMAYNFVRLYQLTGEEEYKNQAEKQISYLSACAKGYPAGYCMFLVAKLLYENPPTHISIALKDAEDLPSARAQLPFLADVELVSDNKRYPIINNKTTYYVCKDFSCLPPQNSIGG